MPSPFTPRLTTIAQRKFASQAITAILNDTGLAIFAMLQIAFPLAHGAIGGALEIY